MANGSTVHYGPMPNVHCGLIPKKMRYKWDHSRSKAPNSELVKIMEIIDWAAGWLRYGEVAGQRCGAAAPRRVELLTCDGSPVTADFGSLYNGLCIQKLNGKRNVTSSLRDLINIYQMTHYLFLPTYHITSPRLNFN